MRNSLHISHLDEAVSQLLHDMAREQGISVEDVVKKYLTDLRISREKTTTPKVNQPPEKNAILHQLRGTWSDVESREFEHNTAPLREIDRALWQ
jgi:hypothetical protein